MTKSDLIAELSLRADLPRPQAEKALSVVLKTIASSLDDVGDSVTISGFGTFEVKQRASRKGRHPVTGSTIHIPAKPAIIFRASPKLRKRWG